MGAAPSTPTLATLILNSTNFYRTEYGHAKALTWDTNLASYAQTWANKCVFAHSGGQYGENIAAGWPSLSAQTGVELWGNEGLKYNYSNPGFSDATGHFTQLVWQGTTAVGCAKVSCKNTASGGINGGDFLVCEYNPPGNYLGEFQQNVLAKTS